MLRGAAAAEMAGEWERRCLQELQTAGSCLCSAQVPMGGRTFGSNRLGAAADRCFTFTYTRYSDCAVMQTLRCSLDPTQANATKSGKKPMPTCQPDQIDQSSNTPELGSLAQASLRVTHHTVLCQSRSGSSTFKVAHALSLLMMTIVNALFAMHGYVYRTPGSFAPNPQTCMRFVRATFVTRSRNHGLAPFDRWPLSKSRITSTPEFLTVPIVSCAAKIRAAL